MSPKNSLGAVKFNFFSSWTIKPAIPILGCIDQDLAGAPRRPIKKSPTSLSGAKEGSVSTGSFVPRRQDNPRKPPRFRLCAAGRIRQ